MKKYEAEQMATALGHELGGWTRKRLYKNHQLPWHNYCELCDGGLNWSGELEFSGTCLKHFCQSNRKLRIHAPKLEPWQRALLMQGDQIVYVPNGAMFGDKRCEPGFINSITERYINCFFWKLDQGTPVIQVANPGTPIACLWENIWIANTVSSSWPYDILRVLES